MSGCADFCSPVATCLLVVLCSLALASQAWLATAASTTQLVVASSQKSQPSVSDVALAYQSPVPSVAITTLPSQLSPTLLTEVMAEQIDLAVDNVGLTAAQAAANPHLTMFPFMATAIVACYRLDALGSVNLALSTEALAQIFLGAISNWNDSLIAVSNPNVALPNQTITVVLQAKPSGTSLVFTTALSKAWPAFNDSIGATISPDWSAVSYASMRGGLALNLAPAVVLAVDGSIGYAGQMNAIAAGVNYADMINGRGQRVRASTATVNAAATDLGTFFPARATQPVDLTNSNALNAWPIPVMSYAMLDAQYTPAAGCASRDALVQFLLWYYTTGSTVVSTLLSSRQAAPVPSIVLSEMGTVAAVGSTIHCNGTLMSPATQSVTRLNSHGGQAVVISAQLLSAYKSISNTSFQAQANADVVVMEQMANSSIDLGFMVPQNINASVWSAFVDSGDFFVFPLYQLAVSLIYNPELTATVSIPSTQPVLLDMAAQVQLFYGCINTWAHPTLLALNPWLSTLLNGTAPDIALVSGCGTDARTAPLLLQLLSASDAYLAANPDDTATQACMQTSTAVRIYAALASCDSRFVTSLDIGANTSLIQSPSESIIPSLVLGVPGAFGYTQITGSPSYGQPQIKQHGVIANSSLAGLAACVENRFDAATLTVDFASPSDPTCWPTSQQFVTLVRRRYYSAATNTSSCARGLDALKYLQWLFTTSSIEPILQASNFLRLPSSAFPLISPAYVAALDSVLCDDTTLLITLPTVWSTSVVVSSLVWWLASLGLLLTLLAVAFYVRHFRHPVVRSSSPLFALGGVAGCLCLFLAALVLILPPTDSTCNAVSWLWNIGFTLSFGPLFAKTWRIWRIFGRRKLSVIKIPNAKLSIMVAGQLLVDIVLMAVWQALSPLQPYLQTEVTDDGVVHEYTQCGVAGTGAVMFAIVCVVKGLLLLFGAMMAFSTRHVTGKFNESSAIALAIYNVVFSVGIVVPIALLISALGDVLLVLQLFLLLWIGYFTLTALVGTRVLLVYDKTKRQAVEGSVLSDRQSAGLDAFSFVSLSAFHSLPLLQAYLGALQEHVKEAEGKMARLKTRGTLSTTDEIKGRMLQPARAAAASSSETGDNASRLPSPSAKKQSVSAVAAAVGGSASVAPAPPEMSSAHGRRESRHSQGEHARRNTATSPPTSVKQQLRHLHGDEALPREPTTPEAWMPE